MAASNRPKTKDKPQVCEECKINKTSKVDSYKDGTPRYDNICTSCRWKIEKGKIILKKRPRTYKPYRFLIKKEKCKNCNFVPIHSVQLEIDHIDGNHNNNEISNLQVLCVNCHRLKTYLNKDYLPKIKRNKN